MWWYYVNKRRGNWCLHPQIFKRMIISCIIHLALSGKSRLFLQIITIRKVFLETRQIMCPAQYTHTYTHTPLCLAQHAYTHKSYILLNIYAHIHTHTNCMSCSTHTHTHTSDVLHNTHTHTRSWHICVQFYMHNNFPFGPLSMYLLYMCRCLFYGIIYLFFEKWYFF